jgi:DNA polymerase/3'-5' exonuclease PolX
MDNHTIARRLAEQARQLAVANANLYRVRAYRRAAAVIMALDRPLAELVAEEGRRGLEALPGIGPHLCSAIAEALQTGELGPFSAVREPPSAISLDLAVSRRTVNG